MAVAKEHVGLLNLLDWRTKCLNEILDKTDIYLNFGCFLNDDIYWYKFDFSSALNKTDS